MSEYSKTRYFRIDEINMGTTIKFGFLGDLLLGGEFLRYAEKNNIDRLEPFKIIETHLSDTDILFVNLEGPIFNGAHKRPNVTSILSNHPDVIQFLSDKKTCVINLANNHIMDFGYAGLEHTLMLLKKSGIYFVGAGEDYDDANKELIIECKGKRIAFLAFTSDDPYIGSIIAGQNSPGCASFLEMDKIIKRIENLRTDLDIICVSLHWGYEYFLYPSAEQVKIAHLLVDAGATYIVGHHPHVAQGIELYKGSLIMYSLGNFLLPPIRSVTGRLQLRKPISKEFKIVKSKIDDSKNVDFEFIGGNVNEEYKITPFDIDGQHEFAGKIRKLSKPFSSADYEKFWIGYKDKREKELNKESLVEAYKKLLILPPKEILKSISLDDIKRNLSRLFKVILALANSS